MHPLSAHLQNSASSIIEQSIQYHDPKGNWSKFKANLNFNSIVERNGKVDTSDRHVHLDISKNNFYMNLDVNRDRAELFLNKKECGGQFLDKSKNQQSVLNENNLTCDRAKMYNSYYRYLLGMPMKLRDPGTIIHDDVMEIDYKGKLYDVIKVTYEPNVGTYTWLFYFDKETRALDLMEFSKDGTFQNGETIELNNKLSYQKMILPGQLKWLVLPERNFLAEENIKYLDNPK